MTANEAFFRSVLEQDGAPVVLCDTEHTVVYMNPAAKRRYAAQGGGALVGKSLRLCHPPEANARIDRVLTWFRQSEAHNRVYTFRNDEEDKDVYMVALRDESGALIGYYEKHEYRARDTGALYAMDGADGSV